jgi:isopenicillin N synthase-like dioxygenase
MDAAIPPLDCIAQLPVLDARKLLQGDEVEIQNLLHACKTHGFFSLNLDTDETSYMLKAWNDVLAFMDQYFGQPTEVKLRDERHSDTHGFVLETPGKEGAYADSKQLRALRYLDWCH